jgi:hypothetical protein
VYDKKGNRIATKNEGYLIDVDPQANSYAVSEDGVYLKTTGDGNRVVHDRVSGNRVAADKDGNVVKDPISGYPKAVGRDGNYQGNVVYNDHDNRVALDAGGNVVTEPVSGYPYAIGKNGQFQQTEDSNYVAYQNGKRVAIDTSGKVMADDQGNAYMVGDKGYLKDKENNFLVYGKPDFVNHGPSESAKPVPNNKTGTPDEMLAYLESIPGDKERTNPEELRGKLFFAGPDGALDSYRLLEALKHYNPRDVYEALMLASTGKSLADLKNEPVPEERGGINPKVVGPSEEQATLLASTYLAFNNHNGYIVSFKDGDIPPLVVTLGGVLDGVSNERAYINDSFEQDPNNISVTYHELTHAATSQEGWVWKLDEAVKNHNAWNEAITEFMANQWNNNFKNSYDLSMPVQPMMNGIVAALARDGDIRDEEFIEGPTPESSAKGMDILRRAVFGGEEEAAAKVIKHIQQYEQRYGTLEIKAGKTKVPAPVGPLPPPEEESSLSPGAIAGIVAGSIAATGGVVAGTAYYLRNRGRNTGNGGV